MSKSPHSRRFLAVLALAAALFAACAVAPPAGPGGEFSFLEGGGSLYLAADLPGARPILEAAFLPGLSGGEALLDRTRRVLAAFYGPAAERGFRLAAWGSYPRSRAGLGLSLSSRWVRDRSPSGRAYWRSPAEGLSLYLDSRLLLLSGGGEAGPFPLGQGARPPEALAALSAGAVLSGWAPEPGDAINGFLSRLGLPLHAPLDLIVFALYPAPPEQRFTAALLLETPGSAEAAGLASLLGVLRNWLPPAAALGELAFLPALLAQAPEQRENTLLLRSAPLRAGDIALLFSMISLH
ncbi:MAG: hypothetical protein LBQ35_09390 [Spirochaetaceae bacterium]|nr:hypothetical protein [Spirochaetaceae bacterium]